MKPTKRNYRGTFILDNRGKEESIDQLIESVKSEILAVSGEVGAIENLGRRDFARVTDKKLTAASFVQVDFAAPADGPARLRDRIRLNPAVYRVLLQSI